MTDWFDEILGVSMDASLLFDDGEDEIAFAMFEKKSSSSHGGSKNGRKPNVERGFLSGHQQLYDDYLAENPTYDAPFFLRRFRMPLVMFKKILNDVEERYEYFRLRTDAVGKIGLSPLQKCTAAIRMLAYGCASDSLDETVRIGESTGLQTLRNFCKAIIELYGEFYMRSPNESDINRLMAENSKRGFPGMIASIDCMHWRWKNCPVAYKGQYQGGREGKPTIILEACASYDTHIWHSFFGCPGSCNDVNVLDRSPLVNNIIQRQSLGGPWTLNGRTFRRGYLLADGIYPNWPIFLKTVPNPTTEKNRWFAQEQEAARKDVERAFGILQERWQIIDVPCRLWDQSTMADVINTVIILHNMRLQFKPIVSDEEKENYDETDRAATPTEHFMHAQPTLLPGSLAQLCEERQLIKDGGEYRILQDTISDHVWSMKGSRIVNVEEQNFPF